MENRERDRVSQRTAPTEAGGVNRRMEEEKGREHNSGTNAELGQKVGRSENFEGGNMDKRNEEKKTDVSSTPDPNKSKELGNEPTRRPGSEGYGSSSAPSVGKQQSGSEKVHDKNELPRDEMGKGK